MLPQYTHASYVDTIAGMVHFPHKNYNSLHMRAAERTGTANVVAIM